MHNYISSYEIQRNTAWIHIEKFFQHLPDSLVEMGWQFSQRLARKTAPSGQFRDALKHPATARVAYLPLWYIQALLNQGVSIPHVERLQTHLFASSFLGFCAIRIHDDLIDEDKSETAIDELLLANLLTVEATSHLQALFNSHSPFWAHHTQHWREYTQAVQCDKIRDASGLTDFDNNALLNVGRKAALLKSFPIAVALYADKDCQIKKLETLMDFFNTAIQINNDLQSLEIDIANGHYTLPNALPALAAGYAKGTHPPADALRNSLVMSTAIVDAHERAQGYYEEALEHSRELGIEDLSNFISWHIEDLSQSSQDWQSRCVDTSQVPTSFLEAITGITNRSSDLPDLPTCIERAEAFLVADPEFRESWEVQRTGVWGQSELIGDAFSRATIAEVLARRNKATADQIEDILKLYQKNGWRYFRNFEMLPPDIDDIGQAIRLLKYTDWNSETKSQYMETPLRWLSTNRLSDGGFPVWLTRDIEDMPQEGWVTLGGMRCIACEANLLDALSEINSVARTSWFETSVKNVVAQWKEQKYDGIYYYKPAYGAAIVFRLFNRLGLFKELQREDDTANIAAGVDALSLAAGLQLSALNAENPDPAAIRLRMQQLMGKQSFDGGWEAAETYRCCGTDPYAISWHGGRMLTTAYVLSALYQLESKPFTR